MALQVDREGRLRENKLGGTGIQAMKMEQERLREEIRTWGRRALGQVWRRSERGDPLNPEEERLARILREHREFAPVWAAAADRASLEETGAGEINPFLHVQVHMIVEAQIRTGQPPGVARVIGELENSGMTRHEAIHAAGKILTLELHRAMVGKGAFDSAAYLLNLRKLPRRSH